MNNVQQAVTPAAQIVIAVIPIVGIVMGATVIFFYLLWRHRQIIRQIEAGIYERPNFSLKAFCLLAGAILTGIGTALTILFALVQGISYALLGGLIPLAAGIGFLCARSRLSPTENDTALK